MSKRNVTIIPPESFENIELGAPKDKAAGIPAVVSAMKHIREEMGLISGIKVLNKMNQKGGFDCPGCAWPDPDDHRSRLGEYCENGAKAIAEEDTDKLLKPDFFSSNSVEDLSKLSDYNIGKAGRITQPMYLKAGSSHYTAIEWDDAFKLIADKLKDTHPDEAVFYTSGRTSNEAAFMYQLFVRQYGTNNLPDCSNMCHESSGTGLSATVGIGKGSVTLDDLHCADLIIVMGQNPGTNHPRMLSALQKCKQNGGSIVSVNPIPEAGNKKFIDPQSIRDVFKGGTQLEDLFLQVKINGDVALLKAAMLLVLEHEEKHPGSVFDKEFIEKQTENFEDYISDLKKHDFTELKAKCGIEKDKIEAFAKLLIEKKNVIICWAMGLTQHKNGVGNVQEVVNILLSKGSIGKKGAGTCPVRGHSNVQGDRTMGIWEKPQATFLDKLDNTFGIKSPRNHGYDVVDAIKAMRDGKVKVFIGMGGNFISATPDSELTGKAMQNCDLTVHVSTKLNRSHLVTGKEALILPCLSRIEIDKQKSGEQFVSVENSMGVVSMSKGTFKPKSSKLMSEPAIVAGMGKAMFGNTPVNWEEMASNYDVVRDKIEAVIPGFDNYNKRVRIPEGFYLPNGARDRKFTTDNGKAKFTINEVPNNAVKEGKLIMMTIRTHDQYNTTIYGMDDRYRGIYNERRVVLMNEEDMTSKGLSKLDVVHLKSHFDGEVRTAKNFKVVPYPIAKGCVGTYFPETNVLVPINSVAEKSNTPASKFVEISIEKA